MREGARTPPPNAGSSGSPTQTRPGSNSDSQLRSELEMPQQEEVDGLFDKLASKVGVSPGETGVRGRGGKGGTHESALGA